MKNHTPMKNTNTIPENVRVALGAYLKVVNQMPNAAALGHTVIFAGADFTIDKVRKALKQDYGLLTINGFLFVHVASEAAAEQLIDSFGPDCDGCWYHTR